MDAAWARVRREISQVARQGAEQIRRWSLSRAWADTEAAWVRVGLAWQRLALAAQAGGLAVG